MFEPLESIAAQLRFRGAESPIGDDARVSTICQALEDTAALIEDELAHTASMDISNLRTLSQGFRAASQLVRGLHENASA